MKGYAGLDEAMLAEIGASPEMLERLIALYVQTAEQSLARLREALAGDNVAEWGEALHFWAGAAASLGASITAALNDARSNMDWVERSASLDRIAAEWRAFAEANGF